MYLRHALSQRVVQRLTHCGSRTPLRLSRLSSQSSPQLALGRCRLSTASAVMKRRPSTTNMKSAVATTAAVAIAAVAGVAAAAPASDSVVPLAGGEDPMWAKEATFRTLNIESRRKRLSEAGANHLLYHTLWGKDKLEEYSLWMSEDNQVLVARILPGKFLVGHPGIVHGGFTAAVLDNLLGTLYFLGGSKKMGFTANLTINYKSPWMQGVPAVFVGRIAKKEGRKVFIEGYIRAEDNPRKIATATSLFIVVRDGYKNPANASSRHGS